MKSLISFAPTLAHLFGISPPHLAQSEPFPELSDSTAPIRKALIFCPDAFGVHALEHLPALENRLKASSTHEVALESVYPPVTPVCFASLFTGALPEAHGIQKYEKPVLTCDTVFDAFIRAGKKVAIVAVAQSSVDLIFRGRNLDYFSMPYDPLVTLKAEELIVRGEHDLIVAYHQEYDDLLHDTNPFSELALKALEHHVESWEYFTQTCQKHWQKEFLVAFTPDHGAHTDSRTGRGDHGENRPEDMNLRHFFYLK
ncbi:MAG: alkaline phosphatase family protein [Bdellovibrionia bacterium]